MTGGDKEQRIQERQYEYPYHYLPRLEDGRFTQTQYWSWGMHYLGGMRVVLDQLAEWSFDSLVDVGCGDGRFLRELAENYPEVTALGVDYSERSIAMANGINPHLEYEVHNILEEDLDRRFDVATCIEVLEHIPPDDCAAFVAAIVDTLTDVGRLILTVPHSNKPVSDKHYQHFDSEILSELLEPHFDSVEFVPFDRQSKLFTALELAIGGRGTHVIVNSPPITNTLWKLYRRRYLYAPTEDDCRRIAAVCER
jgi:2-polyprenyl-3-methyl-5-hydroxy-6-metoxy-1,4-benzoquinol methylase